MPSLNYRFSQISIRNSVDPHNRAGEISPAFLLRRRKGSTNMATFHFRLKSGRNAIDHALYIARQGFHSERNDLITSGHGNLPSWANEEPRKFWKAAEAGERKNGAVYREAVIALPNELTPAQIAALVEELIAKIAQGKPYQFAIHAPTSSLEGEPNPHAHVMTSDRVDDGIERSAEDFFSRYNATRPEAGGRRKASGGRNALQLRDEVIAKRKLVADTINSHLELNGHDARVDHRTLKDQGIERKAEQRIAAFRIERMSDQEKAQRVALRRMSKKSK